MSKYNKFEDFMEEVVNEADNKCRRRYGKSLSEAYAVEATIINMMFAIIRHGWWLFVALVALFGLGTIAFGAALLAFVNTPPGIIIVGLLAVTGGVTAIRIMYKNKVLPMAVRDTGNDYKEEFENHIGNETYIDRLIDRASDDLLRKATDINRFI